MCYLKKHSYYVINNRLKIMAIILNLLYNTETDPTLVIHRNHPLHLAGKYSLFVVVSANVVL